MVLGQVIGVEAGAVVGLDQLEPRLVIVPQRLRPAVEMVEDAEVHFCLSFACGVRCRGLAVLPLPACGERVGVRGELAEA